MFTNSQVQYLSRESLRSFYQMKGIAVISTLIMSVALLMLTLFTLLTVNLQAVARVFQGEIEVVAFLHDGHSPEEIQGMQQRLLQDSGVASVSFVSKAEALEEFKRQLGPDADLLEVLEENPLPASLRLRLQEEGRTSERLELLSTWIREMEGVAEVRYGDQWVERLESYIQVFLLLTLIVGIVVAIAALFVISNTVRLTVMARGRTIEIMRLVGATDWFIRTPFVVEGALQGGAAGAIAMTVLWAVHHYATQFVGPLIFYDGPQVAGFVALCAIVSALGSLTSLRRFLRN